jgi:hypothetical protein
MELVKPALEHLPSYIDALRRGWSPDTVRAERGAEELEEIAGLLHRKSVPRFGFPDPCEECGLRRDVAMMRLAEAGDEASVNAIFEVDAFRRHRRAGIVDFLLPVRPHSKEAVGFARPASVNLNAVPASLQIFFGDQRVIPA